jgi:hypothetical protein
MKEAQALLAQTGGVPAGVPKHYERAVETIAQALHAAEQRGRQQGVECAARVADREANTFNESLSSIERDAEYLKARAISREIRTLVTNEEKQKESGS